MFIRATEMNSTDLSLGGFFDVNRNLFKSVSMTYPNALIDTDTCLTKQLMATMVTYLVVLLQFQISIPTEKDAAINGTEPV